ncbi:hypothetical protein Q3G72_034365 [Acer saccharum]|nr:hypothetical protein Q3G72_034365 [Acer saccharum]
MAAIYSKGDDPTKYVDKWYLKDTYKKCYSSVLHGIRMENLWFKTNMSPLLPPIDVKQAGRLRKLRIKEIGEVSPNARKIARMHKVYTCSKCHQAGHSAKTCAKRAELQAKLKKKNPRKSLPEKSRFACMQTDICPSALSTCRP